MNPNVVLLDLDHRRKKASVLGGLVAAAAYIRSSLLR